MYNEEITQETDSRVKPKTRKHPELWQAYQWYNELVEMRKKHLLRISSVERGKCEYNIEFEEAMMGILFLDQHIENMKVGEGDSIKKIMFQQGRKLGAIWEWCTSIRGLGESLSAQILSQIDDINNFDTVAKLWRYAGYGIGMYWVDDKNKVICPQSGWKKLEIKGKPYRVWTIVDNDQEESVTHVSSVKNTYAIPYVKDAEPIERVDYLKPEPTWQLKKLRDQNVEGYHSPFNRKFKAILWNLMECFVKTQTPHYSDIYYAEKKRLRGLYPERIVVNGKVKYNDAHIDNMAKRKVKKEFLKDLWVKWRELEFIGQED